MCWLLCEIRRKREFFEKSFRLKKPMRENKKNMSYVIFNCVNATCLQFLLEFPFWPIFCSTPFCSVLSFLFSRTEFLYQKMLIKLHHSQTCIIQKTKTLIEFNCCYQKKSFHHHHRIWLNSSEEGYKKSTRAHTYP